LNEDWLDAEFNDSKNSYKVVGLDLNRPKNSVCLVRLSDMEQLVCPPSLIKRYLDKSPLEV
jgi:hypothetical protein